VEQLAIYPQMGRAGVVEGAITADTDLRVARYFGVSDGFFLQMQTDYDLMEQRRKIGDRLKAIKPRAA
jgi:plasmid maintenance system antidote protein VapI